MVNERINVEELEETQTELRKAMFWNGLKPILLSAIGGWLVGKGLSMSWKAGTVYGRAQAGIEVGDQLISMADDYNSQE